MSEAVGVAGAGPGARRVEWPGLSSRVWVRAPAALDNPTPGAAALVASEFLLPIAVCRLGRRLGREQAQPQPAGQEPGRELALDAVAEAVQGRGEAGQGALARGDDHDPPPMPLLPGAPTSYSQSPELSYNPAVHITARAKWHTAASTTRSPVRGLTPPSARVAPMAASSVTLTRTQLWRV